MAREASASASGADARVELKASRYAVRDTEVSIDRRRRDESRDGVFSELLNSRGRGTRVDIIDGLYSVQSSAGHTHRWRSLQRRADL